MSNIQDQAQSPSALTDGSQAVAAVERPEYIRRQSVGELLRGDLGSLPVLLTFVVIVIFFTVYTDGVFLKPVNLSNLAQQIAVIGVVGLGSILVLLLGEIDLSVAAVSVLCSVVMAVLTERLNQPAAVAIPAALLFGALVGFVNGFLV